MNALRLFYYAKPNGMATRSRSILPCGNSEVAFDMLTLCKPSEYNLFIQF